jgi:UDP-2,3-diacylglucosamine hydrolase
MSANSVYFASDTHFGAGSAPDQRRRVDRFLAWLEDLPDGAELYLLGDIFDFWLDYPTFMPKTHLEILYGLRRLQDRQGRIRFVGGNHDIWCARYLEDSLGIPSLPCGAVVEHQGVRLRLHHGDGLLGGDLFYEIFRAAVRNPLLVFVAKSLHPEILNWLAGRLSETSRKKDRGDEARLRGKIEAYGRRHDHSDVDLLVIGHIHHPCIVPFERWSFACLGDWVASYTYGRLRDGRFEVLPVEERP